MSNKTTTNTNPCIYTFYLITAGCIILFLCTILFFSFGTTLALEKDLQVLKIQAKHQEERLRHIEDLPLGSNIGLDVLGSFNREISKISKRYPNNKEIEKTKTIFRMIQISKFKLSVNEAEEMYEIIKEISNEYQVDPRIILSLAAVETQFINGVAGDNGTSKGIMQVRDTTVADFCYKTGKSYSLDDMEDVRKNVEVALWVYNINVEKYGVDNNIQSRVIAYNTGNGTYKKHRFDLLNGELNGKEYTYWNDFLYFYSFLSF